MRGTIRVIGAVVPTLAAGSDVALAQQYPPPIPKPSPAGIETLPTEGSPAGADVAFTGTDITVGMLLLVALVIVGAVLLVLGRRRARTRA
jgi:hypothetical protein